MTVKDVMFMTYFNQVIIMDRKTDKIYYEENYTSNHSMEEDEKAISQFLNLKVWALGANQNKIVIYV